MRLADCEVTHRHIRGHNVAFLFGTRAISDAEALDLANEWREVYGPIALPGYVSPEGWRALAVPLVGPIAASIKVDEAAEVIDFAGTRFSAELLRAFSAPTPDGLAFRVLASTDGVAQLGRVELPAKPQATRQPKAPPAAAEVPKSPTPPAGAQLPLDKPAGGDPDSGTDGTTTKGEA